MAGVLDVLLDLSLLPARGRIAKLGLEQIVTGHGREAGIDLAFLAAADPVDRCAHVVIDPPPGNAAQNPEGVVVGIEQHLVRLQRIGPHDEGTAVAQLEVGNLQLGALAADDRPVFRPVELERLAGIERQRHEGAAPARLHLTLTLFFPVTRKGGDTAVRAFIAKAHQIGVQLLDRALLLARPVCFRPQPGRQPLGIGIELARPLRHPKAGLDLVGSQVFADRVPRQPCAPRNLPDRKSIPQMPAPDNAQ